jgi:hypothetical protein
MCQAFEERDTAAIREFFDDPDAGLATGEAYCRRGLAAYDLYRIDNGGTPGSVVQRLARSTSDTWLTIIEAVSLALVMGLIILGFMLREAWADARLAPSSAEQS